MEIPHWIHGESHEQSDQRLAELVCTKTLASEFYGFSGALLLDEIRSYHLRRLGRRTEALSTRSSTYYAAARDASAQAANTRLPKKLFRLALGLLCKIRSERLADKLVTEGGGFELLPPNQADVYVHTILARKRYEEAVRLAGILLNRADASPDNKALMKRIQAEVLIIRGRYRDAEQLLDSALQSDTVLPPLTILRLLRTKGVLYDQRRNTQVADSFFERARAIALQHNFSGQLEKIKARQ